LKRRLGFPNVDTFSAVGGILPESGSGETGLQAALSRGPEWPATLLIPSKQNE